MLLTVTCAACGARGRSPCAGCLAGFRPPPALPAPPGVDECVALVAYEGPAREVLARLKHRNQRVALPGLAVAAASLVAGRPFDVVTWAPTTPARRRDRGFDQSALLARRVARHLHLPCRQVLARPNGPAQTGRSAAERWTGPAFTATRRSPPCVLLVDDVVTTGATVAAAARALRVAGATRVVVLALGRTPSRPLRSVTKVEG